MKNNAITQIERHIRLPLLPEIRALYERADGDLKWDKDCYGPVMGELPMRLMSSAEAIRIFDSYGSMIDLRGSAGFWEGMNGTYAFVYLTGPLQGRVYFWDYDGRHTSIAFRSIDSFLQALEEDRHKQDDWYNIPTDYFIDSNYFYHGKAVCRSASTADVALDLAAREELRCEYLPENIKDELDELHYASNIMALTPPDRTEEVIRFLNSEDMWVQERACEILGNREYHPAIDQLAEVVQNGMPNGRSAARRALQRMRPEPARQRFRELDDR